MQIVGGDEVELPDNHEVVRSPIIYETAIVRDVASQCHNWEDFSERIGDDQILDFVMMTNDLNGQQQVIRRDNDQWQHVPDRQFQNQIGDFVRPKNAIIASVLGVEDDSRISNGCYVDWARWMETGEYSTYGDMPIVVDSGVTTAVRIFEYTGNGQH
jgi:hypothetical protein